MALTRNKTIRPKQTSSSKQPRLRTSVKSSLRISSRSSSIQMSTSTWSNLTTSLMACSWNSKLCVRLKILWNSSNSCFASNLDPTLRSCLTSWYRRLSASSTTLTMYMWTWSRSCAKLTMKSYSKKQLRDWGSDMTLWPAASRNQPLLHLQARPNPLLTVKVTAVSGRRPSSNAQCPQSLVKKRKKCL